MLKYKFSLLLNCLISALLACIYIFYIPLCTWWRSPNEFNYENSLYLIIAFLPYWLFAFCFLFLLCILAAKFLPTENIQLIPSWPKTNITPFHVLLLGITAALLIEGSFLSLGAPQLSGDVKAYNSLIWQLADTAIWCAIIIGSLLFWRKLAHRFLVCLCMLTLFASAGAVDEWLHRNIKIPISISEEQVYDAMQFHPKDNVIVIVPDSLDGLYLNDVFNDNNDFLERFDGFTMFKNNLTSSTTTEISIPSILFGKVFETTDFYSFRDQALFGKDSMPQTFFDSGYNVYITSISSNYSFIISDFNKQSKQYYVDTSNYFKKMYFRFMPQIIKHIVIKTIDFGSPNDSNSLLATNNDLKRYDYIASSLMDRTSNKPTFHFHHLYGAHPPLQDTIDESLQENERYKIQHKIILNKLLDLFEIMKTNNIYDSSTIIILGDHGATHKKRYYSALMVKPANSNGQMKILHFPTSNAFVLDLLKSFIEKGSSVKTMNNFINNIPTVRYIIDGWNDTNNIIKITLKDGMLYEEILKKTENMKHKFLLENKKYTFLINSTSEYAYPKNIEGVNLHKLGGMQLLENTNGLFSLGINSKNKTVGLRFNGFIEGHINNGKLIVTDMLSKVSADYVLQNINDRNFDFSINNVLVDKDNLVHIQIYLQNEKTLKQSVLRFYTIEVTQPIETKQFKTISEVPFNWFGNELSIGSIGFQTNKNETFKKEIQNEGWLSYGPYVHLVPGDYTLELEYSSQASTHDNVGFLDIVCSAPDDRVVGLKPLKGTDTGDGRLNASFTVTEQDRGLFEFRTHSRAGYPLTVKRIVLRQTRDAKLAPSIPNIPLGTFEWPAAFLPVTTAASKTSELIVKKSVQDEGCLSYGPYVRLRKGTYRLSVDYVAGTGKETTVGAVDVACGDPENHVIANHSLYGTENEVGRFSGTFSVSGNEQGNFEIRTYGHKGYPLAIKSIVLEHVLDNPTHADAVIPTLP